MEIILVAIIVAVAVFFAARRLLRTLKGKDSCNCGCQNCPYSNSCSRKE